MATKRKMGGDFKAASATAFISPAGMTGIDDTLTVQMLGAGQEVGRSCCVIKFKGRIIVCDAGVHPAFSGMAALPFLDELDWSTVDCILITHFHLDHAASLTYVMEKVSSSLLFVAFELKFRMHFTIDEFQGRQGSRLHVPSYQSSLPLSHE